MSKLSIYNSEGKEIDSIELPDETFGGRINQSVIHQAVVMYQANLRQGNASTKERADVSGGGKKPFRQKGTGRARAGSSRSPLWHKGGVTFGPHPRDFSYTIPKKIKMAALRESIKVKLKSNSLFCIDQVEVTSGKTKDFVKILTALKLKGKILGLLDGTDEAVSRATSNVARFNTLRSVDVNAYDVIRSRNILATKQAVEQILKRVK